MPEMGPTLVRDGEQYRWQFPNGRTIPLLAGGSPEADTDSGTDEATTEDAGTDAGATDTSTDEASDDTPDEVSDDASTDDGDEELTRVRAALKRANAEAADHRHKAREAQTARDEAIKREEAMKADIARKDEQIAALELAALRRDVASDAGIPLQLADRLVGSDRDALVEDAKRLSGLVKKPDGDIGATRGGQPANADIEPGFARVKAAIASSAGGT